MLNESLTLLVVGMGTVCVFLSLLVIILYLSASYFASWPDDEEDAPPPAQGPNDHLIEIAIALAAIERSDA